MFKGYGVLFILVGMGGMGYRYRHRHMAGYRICHAVTGWMSKAT